jgi:hypothetical protein
VIQAFDSLAIQPRAWASLVKACTRSWCPLGQVTNTYHSEKMPNGFGSIFGSVSVMAAHYATAWAGRYVYS